MCHPKIQKNDLDAVATDFLLSCKGIGYYNLGKEIGVRAAAIDGLLNSLVQASERLDSIALDAFRKNGLGRPPD
jgi:hypothetical protein